MGSRPAVSSKFSVEPRIADPNFLLYKLGQTYANRPVDAIKEFASNSIDNMLLNGLKNIDVDIYVDGSTGTLYVQDNGTGMTPEKLASLPENFGKSKEKRESVVPVIGENALGLLAYQGFDPRSCRMTIYSAHRDGNSGLWYLSYPSANDLLKGKKIDGGKVVRSDLPANITDFDRGTLVTIYNIPKPIFNRFFTPSRIQREISIMYDPLLRNQNVRIRVIDMNSKDVHIVQPVNYRGEIIIQDSVPVEYTDDIDDKLKQGKVEFTIFGDKGTTNQRVRMYTRGVKLKDSVTEISGIDDENKETFLSGHVSGFFNEDICRLNQERLNYIPNKQLDDLVTTITMIQEDIYGKSRIFIENKEDKEYRQMGQDFTSSAEAVLRALPKNYPDLALRVRIVKSGPDADEPVCVIRPDTAADVPERISRRQEPKVPRYTPHITEFGLDEDRSRRSTINGSVIHINAGHPDFKMCVNDGTPNTRAEYIWRQMAEQVAAAEVIRRAKINSTPSEKIADYVTQLADDLFFSVVKRNKE